MTATAGVAAGAAAISAANSAQLARIRREKCELFIDSFDSREASVHEMKQYAGCVNLIHPDEISQSNIDIIWWLVLFIFVGFIAGLVRGAFYSNRYDEWFDRFIMAPLIGAIVVMCAEFIGGLIFLGIAFLISN